MDLKNIDLKNLNMADLKEKLAGVDKKTYIKFGIGFFAIILFLIIYYAVLNPIVNDNTSNITADHPKFVYQLFIDFPEKGDFVNLNKKIMKHSIIRADVKK